MGVGSASRTSTRRCHSIAKIEQPLRLRSRPRTGAAAVVDVDTDAEADVERQVAVVLDRDNGLTLGHEAGFVGGVIDASGNVGESKEQAKPDNKSSNSVCKLVSVVGALNIVTPVPAREPEPAST
jgi:hypothetical protein